MDEITAGCVRVAIINRLEEMQQQLEPLGSNWVNGYLNSPGTVGVLGRLTRVSGILAQVLSDVSFTPETGLNTFQGRAWLTSWQSREVQGGVCTLTGSFDSETASRLHAYLCSKAGEHGTEGIVFCLTIHHEEPATT